MVEGTGDAARTGKSRKNKSEGGRRSGEGGRRWKKWTAGPTRATRRLGLGCQGGARLPASAAGDWRPAPAVDPGSPSSPRSVGQAPLAPGPSWSRQGLDGSILLAGSAVHTLHRVSLRKTAKHRGTGGNQSGLADWLGLQRCRRDGDEVREVQRMGDQNRC
jgi:hypothetical protein